MSSAVSVIQLTGELQHELSSGGNTPHCQATTCAQQRGVTHLGAKLQRELSSGV